VAKNIVEIQMDVEQLSCVVDDLPPAKLRLLAKMEKVLWLLKDSLGSTGCFFARFWGPGEPGVLQNQSYPHLCVPNSTLLEYRLLKGRQELSRPDILDRAWLKGFPEWTSNVSYYRPNEYAHRSDATSCGVRGIIAFAVFEPYQPINFGAVLELVTIEEKQDFDLEKEKVVQALQVCFHYIYIYIFNQILLRIALNLLLLEDYHKAIHSNYLKYKEIIFCNYLQYKTTHFTFYTVNSYRKQLED